MTKQMEGLKEQLKSKEREIGEMEDELDAKTQEINQGSKSIKVVHKINLVSFFSGRELQYWLWFC